MTLLISHRGNTSGINSEKENSPEYIQEALDKGFYVMVNAWLLEENIVALGTDSPMYHVDVEFLKFGNIICKAMTAETLEYLLEKDVHCFYSEKDSFTVTSGGLIWNTNFNSQTLRSIIVIPEWYIPSLEKLETLNCTGICSDRIEYIEYYLRTKIREPSRSLRYETSSTNTGNTVGTSRSGATGASDRSPIGNLLDTSVTFTSNIQ